MIIRSNKTFETNSLFPNLDWYNENNYVIDEKNEGNKELIEKIKLHAPYMELVIDNEKIVDILPIERPPEQITIPIPTTDDYLIDLDFRLSMIELGI